MTFRLIEHVARGGIVAAVLALTPMAAVGQTQTNSITLEWTAVGDDGNVGRATSYQMRYSATDPSAMDTLAWWGGATAVTGLPSPSNPGATETVTIQGLTAGITYYFVLRTGDEVPNWSDFSNVAFAQPTTCVIPDQSPQSFSATDDNGDALLSWSGPYDASATALNVYRGTSASGPFSLIASIAPSSTSYTDGTVGFGTYWYRVRWVSDCGNGPQSAADNVVFTAPVAPAEPKAAVQARPNPSNGPISFVMMVPAGGSVSLRLFDSTGRLTAVVADGTYPAGESTISWPRTSSSGDRVAPGYYELIGTIGGTRVRERLVLLP